jgi:streptomycin 6-kinase
MGCRRHATSWPTAEWLRSADAEGWLEHLPALVSSLETDWSITLGRPYEGGSEAFVAEVTLADGTSAA